MEKDLLAIFREKIARYQIRQNDIAAALGKSPAHINSILKTRKNPTLTTFMQMIEATDQLRPGFANEYWLTVAGRPSILTIVESMDSNEIGVLLQVVGDRIAHTEPRSAPKSVALPEK